MIRTKPIPWWQKWMIQTASNLVFVGYVVGMWQFNGWMQTHRESTVSLAVNEVIIAAWATLALFLVVGLVGGIVTMVAITLAHGLVQDQAQQKVVDRLQNSDYVLLHSTFDDNPREMIDDERSPANPPGYR